MSDLVHMLALNLKVVYPVCKGAGLDGDDSGDRFQPRADSLTPPQLPRRNKLLPVLAPERMIRRAADFVGLE